MEHESAAADGWRDVTRACLAGLAVLDVGFFHIAAVQTPGLDPPPQSAALFLGAAALAVLAYVLVAERPTLGHPAAVLAGAFAVASAAVIVAGTYGAAGPETNPVGPLLWVLVSLAVVAAGVFGWRASRRRERPVPGVEG